jgi:thiosulfate reductase cytochrome b subunit
MNGHRIYLTPTPVRIWHWLNAFGFLALILSGLQIRYPELVDLFGSYRAAVRLHNTAGLVVSGSFLLWLGYYLVVAHSLRKLYVPTREDLEHGLVRQAKYYFLTFFLGWKSPHHPSPDNKFNPLQKSAYLVIMMVLVPLVIATGLLLLWTAPAQALILLVGGLRVVAIAHFLLACALVAFLMTHVYLATMGKTPFEHFKPMWTGWEEESENH